MEAYRKLIESAAKKDRAGIEAAIRDAEKVWSKRTGVDVTWGPDPVIRSQIVDYCLACVIKKAEQISPGITTGIETVHRWRWSQR